MMELFFKISKQERRIIMLSDEEKSEEYVRKIHHDVINWDGIEPDERFYNEIKFKQAYLDGLKTGKPKWHYIKDGVLPNTEFGRVDVTVAYINAFGNPCKKDCCFDGNNFIYWDDRSYIGWKKVDIFGKIYAWKYPEELPEPPKESE